MKIFLAAIALVFIASCGHKNHKGDHHAKSCGMHKKEGKMCSGDHKHKKAEHKLAKMDKDKDGKVSKAEFDKKHEEKFTELDKDSDGFLSKEELEACGCGKDKGNEMEKKKAKK